jgi:hypothetical protein
MRVDVAGNPRGYRPADLASPSVRAKGSDGGLWSEIGSRIERACAVVGKRRARGGWPERLALFPVFVSVQAIRTAYRLALLAKVLIGYDVVVLTGGASFFRGRDLPLLRRLGKRIIVVFTGSDHRPPYLNGKIYRTRPTVEVVAETTRIRRFVALAERHATTIIALSSSAQLHRRPFVHFLALGVPFAPSPAVTRRSPIFAGSGVRILHCPTDVISKGTPTVRAIIEGLRRDGLSIDYVELIGRPHHDILAALAECDFAIDELLSDSPLARFAVEAAWFGKPAVTAGEYAREILHDLPASLIPPSTFIPPEEVGPIVRRLVDDLDDRIKRGSEVEAFVRGSWNPLAVAERFLRIIEGEVPSDWVYDPACLRYVGGWGLSADEWQRSVGAVVAAAGVESLGLSGPLLGVILTRLRDAQSGSAAQVQV